MDSTDPVVRRPVVKSSCTHIRIVSPALCWEEIQLRKSDTPECDTCSLKGQNLWLCLAKGCSYVGCGINAKHHSFVHGKEFRHHLTINLTNLRLWCFSCEKEVFPGHNSPPFNIPEVIPASALMQMARRENSNTSTPQRSTSGAEESDSDLDDEGNRPRGLTGLQNLGNTCYLNSALQALSNCPPLTRFFLDCKGYIRPERNPVLSRSYAKLISELWHKKRLSYVVPSGIVNGIKAVHPMFRGYTQQDAQEFLRCFMDQLHEELKYPEVMSEDDEEEDDDDDSNEAIGESQPESGIASPTDPSCQSLAGSLGGGGDPAAKAVARDRQNSIDSGSSQSELEYETCDSGLSSEQGSQADHVSSDDASEVNEQSACLLAREDDSVKTVKAASPNRLSPSQHRRQNKNRNSFTSAPSLPSGVGSGENNVDTVANLKEMKETANLLSKIEHDNARNQGVPGDRLQKSESGEYLDALSDSAPAANTRSRAAAAAQQQQQQQQQPLPQPEMAPLRNLPPIIQATAVRQGRKRKNIQYESVISHIFDGKILSSVQCLYCERVSTTRETFQDLSLPIPSKDYLQVLHSGHPSMTSGGGAMGSPRGGACGDQLGTQSWLGWMFSWMKSFFVGPTITLRDCLSAFFSADELKGDNMYSCEQCKKLRNGLKYSKVLELPEVLCIHLKRFRHEFFSSKINTYISFPLHGLEMKPYLHKDCKSEITSYDLIAVVCHHGTAGGGHYTAYCLNHINEQWYEYDDQYVTEVDVGQVINCEAYVLFYRKNDEHMLNLRMKAMKLRESGEPSLLQFYVSKQWINRFNTFAEPGPISNRDFLCKHGGVPPHKLGHVDELVEPVEQSVWELLYSKFGGGPVCNRLYPCQVCQEELDMMKARQKWEMENFVALNEEFLSKEVSVINAMSMAWFKEWEAFVKGKTDIPPGPIDNSRIMVYRNGQYQLRPTADYGQLSPDMWNFLHNIYGGGPEAVIRQRTLSSSQSSTTVSSSPPSKDTTTTTTSATGSSSASPNTSSSLSPTPSPPLHSSTTAPTTTTAAAAASSGESSSVPSATSTHSDTPDVAAVKSETTPSTLNNSSSSSSASTITPSRSAGQVTGGEESEGEKATSKPSAMSDSGDNGEETGSRPKSQGSGSGVSTMQEVKGIPHPMDVTRL